VRLPADPLINVFHGLKVAGAWRLYLSDARNDVWIRESVFPGLRDGYFVEAGAGNGFNDSSCYILEREFGWRGLCVEPNDSLFAELAVRRPGSIHENVCLTATSRTVRYVAGGGGNLHPYLSGIRENLLQFKNGGNQVVTEGREISKTGTPLADLLRKHGAPSMIDYAALDLEGSELEVLSSFPFGEYHFRALSMECDGSIWRSMTEILEPAGYREVSNPFNLNCPWERYWLHAGTQAPSRTG
jgi:Methyltransferase FkbM domain